MSTHVTEPGGVASNNPGLVYLRTGRKGVSADQYERNWSRWQSEGMRYVVSLRRANLPREFLKTRTLFQTGRRRLWIVEM
jgi:hypothetical protein